MKHKGLITVFLIYEALCYVAFLTLDILGRYAMVSGIIKLSAVFACFVCVFIHACGTRRGDRNLLQDGSGGDVLILTVILLFTVVSDVFLLFTESISIGVMFFCVVQTLYFIWLRYIMHRLPQNGTIHEPVRAHNKVIRDAFFLYLIRIIIATAACMLLRIKIGDLGASGEIVLVVFYAVIFLGNIFSLIRIIATRRWREGAVNLTVLLTGLILFVLCDVNVALYNICAWVQEIPAIWRVLSGVAMWLFYLPSQLLIIYSVIHKNNRVV